MSYQIHTYSELQQQIHDDLRIQHPEWVEPNGESPMCASYEARLMELLLAATPFVDFNNAYEPLNRSESLSRCLTRSAA